MKLSIVMIVPMVAYLLWPAASQQSGALGPNASDEPMARAFSAQQAYRFLDTMAVSWTRERRCGSCHSNYAYMLARSSFTQGADGAGEVRKFFEQRVANWDSPEAGAKPRWDTEVVATAVALAFDDAQTTDSLHPMSRRALDRMWTLQREDGRWNWLKCDWPPAEADDYYGVVFAAIGVNAAPDRYAETEAARKGLEGIRKYLKGHEAPNLHHKIMCLWAARQGDGLLSAEERKTIMESALNAQRPDGGWSLRTLWGERKRHDGTMEDLNHPASDAYATGLVVYVLCHAEVSPDHPALQRGIAWLKANQRESGRWFVRSLSRDTSHFLSHFGTAYAVMALRACDAL